MQKVIYTIFLVLLTTNIQASQINSVEDYNDALINNGVAWKGSITPSFYTGFAPRIENASRIHFHVARGNQARLTGILDEQAILTYLYQLKKRYELYGKLVGASKKYKTQDFNQVDLFIQLIESSTYGVLDTISDFESGTLDRKDFYLRSLEIMSKLNPGRVFNLKFDLNQVFLKWKNKVDLYLKQQRNENKSEQFFAKLVDKSSKATMILVNELFRSRINIITLTAPQKKTLSKILFGISSKTLNEKQYVNLALKLFKQASGDLFNFNVIQNSELVPALQCDNQSEMSSCSLNYPEFTAIYPVGTSGSRTRDRQGNRVPRFVTYGYRNFVGNSKKGIDKFTSKPHYGWLPNISYEAIGNSIHNPGMIAELGKSSLKKLYGILNIPRNNDTLWIVSRGPISHGCTRMSAGHIWEVRHIFPSSPTEQAKMKYFGNASTDYDVFDIDGDGNDEVMGVDYTISYTKVSQSLLGYALERRRVKGVTRVSFNKSKFYNHMYGTKNQIYFDSENNRYMITKPYISYFYPTQGEKKVQPFSGRMDSDLPLYEQNYEKDKLQFFRTQSGRKPSRRVVKLFGRVNGCGSFATEFATCYENGFEREYKSTLGKSWK